MKKSANNAGKNILKVKNTFLGVKIRLRLCVRRRYSSISNFMHFCLRSSHTSLTSLLVEISYNVLLVSGKHGIYFSFRFVTPGLYVGETIIIIGTALTARCRDNSETSFAYRMTMAMTESRALYDKIRSILVTLVTCVCRPTFVTKRGGLPPVMARRYVEEVEEVAAVWYRDEVARDVSTRSHLVYCLLCRILLLDCRLPKIHALFEKSERCKIHLPTRAHSRYPLYVSHPAEDLLQPRLWRIRPRLALTRSAT